MANSNSAQDPTNSLPVNGASSSMAKLRALQNLSRLKSSSPPNSRPPSTSPAVTLTTGDDEIDWEELFAASTIKEEVPTQPIPVSNFPVEDIASNSFQAFEAQSPVEDLSFLPPSFQEDNSQIEIQRQISQSLPKISDPELEDSSDFFSPPFEISKAVELPKQINHEPIPTLVDQIKLNPETQLAVPDSNNLEIIENTGSYPLTLTEDPTNPNPITEMLKKLQGQFGAQISDAMRRTRANILKATKKFNNKGGDASNLEASLFNN